MPRATVTPSGWFCTCSFIRYQVSGFQVKGTLTVRPGVRSAGASGGGESHSAESVRQRIRAMVQAEDPDDVLSDDAIVSALRKEGVDIARRTVAKYREALRIPSSVQRKREKAILA